MSASVEQSPYSPVVEAGVASPVSPVAPAPSPLVSDSPPESQDVDMDATDDNVFININEKPTTEMLLKSAQEDLALKKNNYLILSGHYLAASKVNPTSQHTKNASEAQKEAQRLYLEAEELLKVLKSVHTPLSLPDEKKSVLVPANLPYLQLTSDVVIKSNKDSFDSVYDFCQEFVTILEAHSLSLDDHWERLLPMCLGKEDRSWFEDKLKNKALNWKMAEGKLLDKYDTPFRKFLNMGRVWSMKQKAGESARAFGSKFQKHRRQAGLEDGVQLVLCFWWNLRQEVREACLIPLSANYGTQLPSKIEDIIDLVSVTTRDSSALLNNPCGVKSASVSGEVTGHGRGKKRASSGPGWPTRSTTASPTSTTSSGRSRTTSIGSHTVSTYRSAGRFDRRSTRSTRSTTSPRTSTPPRCHSKRSTGSCRRSSRN